MIDHMLPRNLDDIYGPGAENADDGIESEMIYICRKHGGIHATDARMMMRDEVCVYVCRRCDSIVDVYADMDAFLYSDED